MLEWIRIVLGLFVFAFGVHLTIFANIGLAPWDCLGMGVVEILLWSLALLAGWLLGGPVGIGTLIRTTKLLFS